MSRARILLVGGAGVFGSRLALGLAATVDADVLIAGRDLAKAQKAARDTGSAGALSLDRASAKVANIAALNVCSFTSAKACATPLSQVDDEKTGWSERLTLPKKVIQPICAADANVPAWSPSTA